MASEPRERVPSDRDVLISKVRYGELTPRQAELEAGRLGLEPFAFRPNPSDLDPMKETTWTLVMAVAWIMWRTPAPVREMWDLYRQEFRFWMSKSWQFPGGPIHEGHFLETKGPADLRDLDALTVEVPPPNWPGIRDPRQAFQLLRVEAERGVLTATGRPSDGLIARQPILPFEWIDFGLGQPHRGDLRPFLAIMVRGEWRVAYYDVRLPAADLRRTFPEEMDAERLSVASDRNSSVLLDGSRAAYKGPVTTKRSRQGRKKGTGSFENVDAHLVEKMLKRIRSKQSVSIAAAALHFAPEAFGTATVDSKRDRLAKRFREKYGSDIARIKSD